MRKFLGGLAVLAVLAGSLVSADEVIRRAAPSLETVEIVGQEGPFSVNCTAYEIQVIFLEAKDTRRYMLVAYEERVVAIRRSTADNQVQEFWTYLDKDLDPDEYFGNVADIQAKYGTSICNLTDYIRLNEKTI